MTQERSELASAIHRHVDEVADHGREALGELAELLYYAEEGDALTFLRRFVFMSPDEKRVLLAMADRMAELSQRVGSRGE
jgi:hypothetical protein